MTAAGTDTSTISTYTRRTPCSRAHRVRIDTDRPARLGKFFMIGNQETEGLRSSGTTSRHDRGRVLN